MRSLSAGAGEVFGYRPVSAVSDGTGRRPLTLGRRWAGSDWLNGRAMTSGNLEGYLKAELIVSGVFGVFGL